ncbi:MAG: response regulator [Segetibacter sp.]
MSNNILLNKNVLVAEDNAISQMVVNHTLLKLGASNVDIAGNGAEALEKFTQKKYDLILADLQMPVMDGYEFARHIRTNLKGSVPIIAMTASLLHEENEKYYECGMNECVPKPITIQNLSSAIQKVLAALPETSDDPHILVSSNVSVDLTMVYEISGNDESYIALMVQTFLDNMPNTLTNMMQCLSDDNWEGLYQNAHRAKSTLSVIKVNEMFDAVFAIEGYAKNKSHLDLLPDLVQEVERFFLIAKELLTKKFNERSTDMIDK